MATREKCLELNTRHYTRLQEEYPNDRNIMRMKVPMEQNIHFQFDVKVYFTTISSKFLSD